jgi:hypothetical protein
VETRGEATLAAPGGSERGGEARELLLQVLPVEELGRVGTLGLGGRHEHPPAPLVVWHWRGGIRGGGGRSIAGDHIGMMAGWCGLCCRVWRDSGGTRAEKDSTGHEKLLLLRRVVWGFISMMRLPSLGFSEMALQCRASLKTDCQASV